MSKILGLEFAPLRIPLERRLQTLAVIYYCSQFLIIGLLVFSTLVALLFTRFWFVPLAYSVWWYYDRDSCSRSYRRSEWIRRWRIWDYYREYFPVRLIKTAPLDPDKNYIFGVHPHGILCFGAFLNFSTDATGFSQLFPGIKPFLLTLEGQFIMPLHRELFLWTGARSASKSSMEYLLQKEKSGNALVLIVGGATEALDAIPGKMEVTLNDRKGFIKLAIKHGADLVPVLSFGENDVYVQKERDDEAFFKKLQKRLTKVTGFSPPLFHGRGIFQYSFGLLPFRKPITTVVGKPISVKKNENPSRDEVSSLHQNYVQCLIQLYEEHKSQYGYANTKLIIK